MGRLRSRVLAVTIVSACGFTASLTTTEDATPADAGPCTEIGVTCAGNELRRCVAKDALPMIEQCNWGCLDGPPPHCGVATPGGALLPTDLVDDPRLAPTVTIGSGGTDWNVDNGQIENRRGSGSGFGSGIEFTSRNNVGVFRFRNLVINGSINFNGRNAVAIVAIGTITINTGTLDLQGCDSNTFDAGPGGFNGGGSGSDAPGSGGGKRGLGGSGACSGGAGGSYGSLGGAGGSSNGQTANPAPGVIVMNPNVAMLVGGYGGGGGGGSGDDRGEGGGGGGAIQLFATGGIVFNGTIDAGGCGGGNGNSNSCGGGGGAGGAILLESTTISFGSNAKLVVNGGGGGGGNDGNNGSDGQPTLARANGGGGSGASSGSGGSGAASAGIVGLPGVNATQEPGGGGGGVGWMRFNTLSGSATVMTGALCSPQFTDAGSTTSEGKVNVQ